MRIVQFQHVPRGKDYDPFTIILMEDGRMFWKAEGQWLDMELPEHPMSLPRNPLGPPPEDRA